MKKFSFVKNSKIFFAISLVLVVVTFALMFTKGFNLDIEFVGGTEFTFDLGREVTGEDEAKISAMVEGVIGKENFSSIRIIGDKKDSVVIRTMLVDGETDYEALNTEITNAVVALDAGITVVSATENVLVVKLPEVVEETETETPAVDADAVVQAVEPFVYKILNHEVNEEGNLVVTYDPNSELAVLSGEIEEGMKALYAAPEAPEAEEAAEETVVEEVAEEAVVEEVAEEAVVEEAAEETVVEEVAEETVVEEAAEETVVKLTETNTVGAEVSSNLKNSAFLATFAAVLLMLIYIAFRFQFSSALAAVVCLGHDVIIMLLAYLVFQIPVSSTIIAAILTILGYSINATIVVFDRVRENVRSNPNPKEFANNVDGAIKSTIWRSLNTTITTLLTIGLVYILGVTSIKEFALPLIVGIVAGAYSSICLSGPLWNMFKKLFAKNK